MRIRALGLCIPQSILLRTGHRVLDRRAFVASGLATLVVPRVVEAQQPTKTHRIGVLSNFPASANLGVFVMAMRDLGYIEGRNLVLEFRSAEYKPDRLPALAGELVNLKVDIIITGGDSELRAAKRATRTIPIVMAPSGDPVAAGYVASLARPGGNITGLSWMSPDLSAKLLEVLRDMVPRLRRVAVLWNAANPVKVLDFEKTRRAGQTLGVMMSSMEVKSPSDFETAFAKIASDRPDGLLTLVDEVLAPSVFPRIAQFATKERLPSIVGQPQYAAAGGLVAYGPTMTEVYRRAAVYVDKILKGAKPADLPVEQPTKLELVINAKTAKTLGLTIPPSLLLRADQVIDP